MSSRRILVTGATGESGRYNTDRLLNQGFAVRAFVHKADERSDKLKARDAEIIVQLPADIPREAATHAGVPARHIGAQSRRYIVAG